ncbi:MAG: sigma 54-interacting transcriptional regulator [Thermoanaerobaculia bacterium]
MADGQRRRPPERPRVSRPALPEPPTVVSEVRRLYERAARVALGEVSVLIQGESGTGKEVLARFIHEASTRSGGPFVALNCAALPRDLLADGRFRQDLYHRIADWTVTLPPLRRRRADVPNQAAYFLAQEVERRGVRPAGISRSAIELLVSYPWPGNVRQLEREMARAALFLEGGDLLETRHLEESIREGAEEAPRGLRDRLAAFERGEIRRALAEAGGDVPAAAESLGIGRSTLYRRMHELGIEREAE